MQFACWKTEKSQKRSASMNKALLTTTEFAKALGISQPHFYRSGLRKKLADLRIYPKQIGKRALWPAKAVDEAVDLLPDVKP